MKPKKCSTDSFWVFDTEDDSKGRVYWVNFYNGVEHVSFDNSDRAVEWLLTQEGEFWAVNLEYDLINLFSALLDKIAVLTYGGFGLLKASIYGKKIHFRNTLRHWPISVEEMGVRLGFPKLPFDPTNLAYCQRDCEVTWLFIKEMFGRYKELGITEIKATLPSTSLAFFTDYWCKANWFRHDDLQIWKFLTQSRYGGRCEIFQLDPIRGYIHEYDINSSYPAAMRNLPFPNLDTMAQGVTVPNWKKAGVACCTVTSPSNEFPLLPFKDPDSLKLLFPVGQFTGTWTYVELSKAIEYGYRIDRVHRAVEYDLMPSPFSEYIDFLYEKRLEVKGKDELMSYTLKILMNALFGKWGEEGELQVISRGKRHTMRQIPRHSNMVWACYVLAYGRLALHDALILANRVGRVLYCDTDSVFVKTNSKEKPFPDSKELGRLSYKGLHLKAQFKLPKLYYAGDNYKAKGVPDDKKSGFPNHLKKTFFEEGIAEFMKPYRWIESKRLHEQANVWRAVTKQLQSEYDKRQTLPNGRTWPLTIGENRVYKGGKKPKRKTSRRRIFKKL